MPGVQVVLEPLLLSRQPVAAPLLAALLLELHELSGVRTSVPGAATFSPGMTGGDSVKYAVT